MSYSIENCAKVHNIPNIKSMEEPINIRISSTDKGLLFTLGYIFALGKKIKITNEKEVLEEVKKYKLSLENPNKSFYLMAYAWEKLFEKDFEEKYEFDKIVGNFKRTELILNDYTFLHYLGSNIIFLISPVRNASEEQKKEIEEYKRICEQLKYKIYVPHLDTVQTDLLGGYTICHRNALGLSSSDAVHMYYDQNSRGSMFDLGVAYACEEPLIIINKDRIEYNSNDFGDNLVSSWNDLVVVDENIYQKHLALNRRIAKNE